MKAALCYFVILFLGASSLCAQDGNAQTLDFESELWDRSHVDAEIVQHLGRKALFLRGGNFALPQANLFNGVVEFDIAFDVEIGAQRGFVGLAFRVQDDHNYEHIYLRPHQSGNPDACQYTPVRNGLSAWQLFGQSTAAVGFERNRWISVRIEFWNEHARLFIDSIATQLFARMPGEKTNTPNGLGLTVASGFAPAYFSNFSFHRSTRAPFDPPKNEPKLAPGTVMTWDVSDSFEEARLEKQMTLPPSIMNDRRWKRVDANYAGIANLAERGGISAAKNTRFARLTIDSETQQLQRLAFGWSDRCRVYLNRKLLFVGDDTYRSRDYRFLGTIGLYDKLVLPLQKGKNELLIAVSESFGGWGVTAQLLPE